MLRFEVRTTSPILISEIFFNSAISQISSPIHRKIPSTSSGTILTLNLKFTSLINCTSAEDFEVEIIFPITPFEVNTGSFMLTLSS